MDFRVEVGREVGEAFHVRMCQERINLRKFKTFCYSLRVMKYVNCEYKLPFTLYTRVGVLKTEGPAKTRGGYESSTSCGLGSEKTDPSGRANKNK